MTLHLNLNHFKIFFAFIILFASAESFAKFKTSEDRDIAVTIIKKFKNDCSYQSSIDKNVVDILENRFKDLSADQKNKAFNCYSQQISQITSAYFIYKKTCDDLTQNGLPGDDLGIMKVLLYVERNKSGIGLNHSLLNDCLRSEGVSDKYFVPLVRSSTGGGYMSSVLDSMKVQDPFLQTRVDVR